MVNSDVGGSVDVYSINNTLLMSVASGGTDTLMVTPNTGYVLNASPEQTYAFQHWSVYGDDNTYTNNPYTVSVVNSGGTYTATWMTGYSISIQSNDTNKGTVDRAQINGLPTTATITVSGDTLIINGVNVTATPKQSNILMFYSFDGWTVDGQPLVSGTPVTDGMVIYANFSAYAVASEGAVMWSNGMYNGSIDIAFKFSGSTNKTHHMVMPLYSATVDEQQNTSWSPNGNVLTIDVSYPETTIAVTMTGDDEYSVTLGNWYGFVLRIAPSTGLITFIPMDSFTDFTKYTLMESQTRVIYSWNAQDDNSTIYEIQHTDTGAGNPVKFSVVDTWTFLNTFGVVLTDPSINISDYFPQYEQIRVNIYAFAVYGNGMTINGKSWDVSGSQVTIFYTDDGNGNNLYATSTTPGAQSRTLTLSNIYITWDGSDCLLTFDSDDWTVNLGTYSNGSETFSFSGLWYFTVSLMEPYTATKTVVSGDWDSMLNIDSSAILLIFLGVMTLTGLICHIKLGLKWLDVAIVVISMIVAFTMLG